MIATEDGVDAMLYYGEDYDDSDAVDGGEEVVGDPVGVHVGGLGDEVGGHLSLAEPVYYECNSKKENKEYLAGSG